LFPLSLVSRPLLTIFISLAGAALYVIYATLRFSGHKLTNQYYYVVPIIIPFISFLLDRAERLHREKMAAPFVIDILIVVTAMWRVIGNVPYVSGHALFLTYAVLTTRSRVALVTAAVVMLEVIYLKFFTWHDWVTPVSGVVLATVAAQVRRRYELIGRRKPQQAASNN
jgi:hypothetical protein